MFNRFRNAAGNLLAKTRHSAAAVMLAATTALVALPAAAGGGGIDVSGVVTVIESAAAPIAAIGAATLIVMVGIKVWKWVRRAM